MNVEQQNRLTERHADLPEITSLRFQGFSTDEIADKLALPKRTIERRLEWIKDVCEAYGTLDD